MNPEELQQQIATAYSKLAPDMQQMFSSMSWMEALRVMSIKYSLNPKQIETLGAETTLVLLGLIRLEEYEDNLTKELEMQDITLKKLLEEVNTTIFSGVKTGIVEAYSKQTESRIKEKYGELDKLDARFAKLPKEVQMAISESGYQNVLFAIGTENKLNIEQMGILEEVTNKVLLGIIHPDKYESELQTKIPIPADKISSIVSGVNEKVLLPIREILKSNWGNGGPSTPSSMDDEIPVPPYGIGMVVEEKVEPIQSYKPVNTNIPTNNVSYREPIDTMPSQININPSVDMFANKLNKMVMSKNSISDQSIPRVTSDPKAKIDAPAPIQQPTSKVIRDPYHEAIE